MPEQQIQKSPAEFFAEHQAIAGFDNLGKSLYTSIRELVENALDACECIHELPDISIDVTECTQDDLNAWNGWGHELTSTVSSSDNTSSKGKDNYFLITVQDNGCGMQHDAIPELLGRVLSSSKYGVRQTRGKFGLGAKMALIWSKKSSGHPILIETAYRPRGGEPPSSISRCVLDIDIYRNEPKILEHKRSKNNEQFIGSKVSVLIAGNWTTYKARILQYLQQLAIITPYAILKLSYNNFSDPKKTINIAYSRRSDQMPPIPQTVPHHPASVNNLIVQHLIRQTKTTDMIKFLSTELSCVSNSIAQKLLDDLKWDDMDPKELEDGEITRLVQSLRSTPFKNPDSSCLSPLGEYNLNLGIQKVLEPDLVATTRDKPGTYEGHPFLVEAAVSLGGKDCKEGITVTRFANRIPLLFEGGADVASRVALTKIKWANYKMDYKRDKIGVFVSIVSTKIPFKGTSKEYIGDDVTEIQQSVKRALQSCCQQLRAHLMKRNALKDAQTRKSKLNKYVPDVSRSLMGILEGMKLRRASVPTDIAQNSPAKRLKLNDSEAKRMVERIQRGEVTEEIITQSLHEAIDAQTAKVEEAAKKENKLVDTESMYLVPLYNLEDASLDIDDPLFTFRPLVRVKEL